MRFAVLTALFLWRVAGADEMVESLLDAADDAAHGVHSCLRTLSFELVDLDMKPRQQTAHVRVGTDGMAVVGDVVVRDGAARVAPRLDIAGLRIKLPEFDLVPRSLAGCHYLELRVPLFEGRF